MLNYCRDDCFMIDTSVFAAKNREEKRSEVVPTIAARHQGVKRLATTMMWPERPGRESLDSRFESHPIPSRLKFSSGFS